MNITTMNYKLAIHCTTSNHAPYIRPSLDGFVAQKTNFPFAAIVVDDASTDNEIEVLWDFIAAIPSHGNSPLPCSRMQKW